MKINIIGTGLFKSGGMRIIFEYGNRFTTRGHDVYYYFPLKPYKFRKVGLRGVVRSYYWAAKNYAINRREIKRSYHCNFTIKGVPIVNNLFIRDADALIATQWPTAFDVHKLTKSKGKKFYFLQDYEIWDADKKMVDKALKLNLERITISHYNKVFFNKEFGIDTKVVLNGIDFGIYNIQKKEHRKNKVVTFIDHYLDNKGVNVAIEVVKRLHSKYSRVRFLSFGHKRFHEIPAFVEFHTNPNDKTVAEDIYGITDIFLYPSIKEGFALPPAEAMACKCAVVTTKAGAIPEYSKHMESAIHVEADNPAEMFNAVSYLLENESELVRICENAYSHIRKTLDWNKSVIAFEKILLRGGI